MKHLLRPTAIAIATISLLTLSPLSASAAPSGCFSSSESGGHAFSSYCSHSAPVTLHQGGARIYFNSGYSSNKGTAWQIRGFKVKSGYYSSGTVSAHWVNSY